MSWQEKFQITVPAKEEAGESWADASSQRIHYQEGDVKSQMPPGYDATSAKDQFGYTIDGMSDVNKDSTPEALDKGFTRKEMKGTDDQYTGEHVDHFYGDAGGFVERNNYLDRE